MRHVGRSAVGVSGMMQASRGLRRIAKGLPPASSEPTNDEEKLAEMLSRRELLAAVAGTLGAGVLSGCTGARTASPSAAASSAASAPAAATAMTRHSYGPDPSQFGDLYLPTGTSNKGVTVVLHGGFWLAEYDLSLGAPLAADLAARGYASLNLEYRRVGDGGGWPTTLQDVADGIDLLASLNVDTSHVVAIGHSAGGQLAAWAAGRSRLPVSAPGRKPKVAVTAVVSQAGVLDLTTAAMTGVGGNAEADFLGGTPTQVPQRYAIADPIKQVPLIAPVFCVHSRADQDVPFAQSVSYVGAARAAGAMASLTEVEGDHFTLIDPTSAAWRTVVDALPGLLQH
jgi:acetyl esterase/lipase